MNKQDFFLHLSCGLKHTLCIDEYNNVWSFGDNSNFATSFSHFVNQEIPKQISIIKNITTIACGYRHSLCLCNNGKVYTFGSNNFGQLGINKSPSELRCIKDPQVLNLPHISYISCGKYFSVCLTENNELYSFGDNKYGQLGVGDYNHSYKPQLISSLSNIDIMQCGGDFVICRLFSGEFYIWGYTEIPNDNLRYNLPYLCDNWPDDIISFKCGLNHILLLSINHLVYSFGSNSVGQCGFSKNIESNITPTLINNIPLINIIECGYEHSMLIDINNNLWVFGYNSFGQLGLEDTNDRYTPVINTKINNIKGLSHGGDCTFIKTQTDEIYVCGNNFKKQLGVNDTRKITKLKRVLNHNETLWPIYSLKNRQKSARK